LVEKNAELSSKKKVKKATERKRRWTAHSLNTKF